MRYVSTARLLALALCTSAVLLGAGPRGCGPVSDTEPLPDPDPDPDPDPCPAVCEIYCPYGNVIDENGCPTCACNPPPLCQSDADCSMGQVCDLSVCLSPCDGMSGDVACPAVCYGQCIDVPSPGCDPTIPNACGDGFACVCRGCAEPGPGGGEGGGSSERPDPGFFPAPVDHCTCEPIEPPPPPACEPSDPFSCGEGATCVCAVADPGFGVPCDTDGCPTPPPSCWCEANPPPTCDPTNPVCENGGECVCLGSGEGGRPACDPNGQSCDFPAPPPPDSCYCVEPPPPPPPSCSVEDTTCPDGTVCACVVVEIMCDPTGGECIPPPPVCSCVEA